MERQLPQPNTYSCYGEVIDSDFALSLCPSLPSSARSVRIERLSFAPIESKEELSFEVDEGKLNVSYRNIGSFTLDGQGCIGAYSHMEPVSAFFRHFVGMNMVALACQMKGRLVLHGSCIATPSGQALLVGDSGAGKSTLSLALAQAGHPLVCDDVAVLDLDPVPRVEQGAPYVKAWEDTLDETHIEPDPLPFLSESVPKRLVPFRPHASKAPLTRIYVLEQTGITSCQPLPFADAFAMLIKHTFMPRSIDLLGLEAQHFQAIARLLEHVTVYRLTRSSDFSSLPECARYVSRSPI